MTEQASEATNPGQAIYDALSDEAKAAVDALPDYPFIGKDAREKADQLVSTLNRVHQRAPEVWSIRPDSNGDVDLRVGRLKLVSCYRDDRLGLLVKRSEDAPEDLKNCIDQNATSWRSEQYPDFRRIVSTNELRDSPLHSQILDAHNRAADELATLPNPNPDFIARHRDDWRVKLAMLVESDVSAPLYVPRGKLGLQIDVRPAQDSRSKEAHHGAFSSDAEAPHEVNALARQIFHDEPGRELARFIADSIQFVQAQHENLWSIQQSIASDGTAAVVLNVAGSNAVAVSRRDVRILVEASFSESITLRELNGDVVADQNYKQQSSIQCRFERGTITRNALDQIQASHQSALQELIGLGYKINHRWKWHRDDLRAELAKLSAMELPPPLYVPADRVGKPMWDDYEAAVPLHTGDTVAYIHRVFETSGLTYTDAQIASFYTALQTKGFVILSGISGTGKSKIAQRFAGMLPGVKGGQEAALAADFIRIAVKPYMKKYKRIRLWKEVAASLPVPPPGTSLVVPFSINGTWGKCRVWSRAETDHTAYLFPQGEVGEQFRAEIREAFAVKFNVDDENERIESIELLTELPIESSSQLEVGTAPNHLFLPVRPDWRDGKALIGYHNPLTGEYVRTDFLDFVIAAGDDFRAGNRNAFFVILDEMNLAHVEYYFADVLSVIESGRDEEGWTAEGIPLAVGEEDADLPAVLKLPPNLYIVGTVNMDETTHPFSPKVLDRAFTIELTEVDFSNYPPEPVEGNVALSDDERVALLDGFIAGGERYPRIDKGEVRAVVASHGQFRTDLDNLNTSLKRYRMHFGYRVFDEIMQFVHNAERNGLFSPEDAFDHAVLMKVLPKFNGSRAKLERPLVEMVLWSRQRLQATEDDAREIVVDLENYLSAGKSLDSLVMDSDDWRYPATGRRAALMMQDLYTDGFASFG